MVDIDKMYENCCREMTELKCIKLHLQLSLKEVSDHLSASDACSGPEGGEVQGARKSVRVAKTQHRRDPSTGIFESKAGIFHLVLLDIAAAQVVNASLWVRLGFIRSGAPSELGALENVEIVVCSMAARVAFGPDCSSCMDFSYSLLYVDEAIRTKNDQIFRNTYGAVSIAPHTAIAETATSKKKSITGD
jgi:hypothetical protein